MTSKNDAVTHAPLYRSGRPVPLTFMEQHAVAATLSKLVARSR